MRDLWWAVRAWLIWPWFVLRTAYASTAAMVLGHDPRVERVIRSWARTFLRLGPVELTVVGHERIDTSRPHVYVANHLSLFDIPAHFLAAPQPARFLAKKELFKIPILAQGMRRIGIVEVDRRASRESHSTINHGVDAALDRGHSLLIYPEGTRSRDGQLHAFKKGAFRFAIQHATPLVPMTTYGTYEAQRPDSKVARHTQAVVVVHEAVPVEGLTLEDVDDLRDRVHAIIDDAYRRLGAGESPASVARGPAAGSSSALA